MVLLTVYEQAFVKWFFNRADFVFSATLRK